jgi:hypothetical protein
MSDKGTPLTDTEADEAEAAIKRMDELLDAVTELNQKHEPRRKRLGRGLIDTIQRPT